MGKTTIVRAALGRAAADGLRVFAARPAAGEAELPYAGLSDLLATVRRDFLAELPGAQRYAIEAALVRGGSGAVVDSHALSRAVLELLRFEAASGNLVMVVDDVQWLDRPTVAALTFALRRMGSLPVRLLVAMRTGGSRAELPFGLVDWDDVRRVEVGALSTTELGVLLAAASGSAAAAAASGGASARVGGQSDVRARARAPGRLGESGRPFPDAAVGPGETAADAGFGHSRGAHGRRGGAAAVRGSAAARRSRAGGAPVGARVGNPGGRWRALVIRASVARCGCV